MKRLILTSLSGSDLVRSGLAEVVIPIAFRFVWGALSSPDDLAAYVAGCSRIHDPATHWSDFVSPWPQTAKKRKHLALAEFCQPYEAVELWFDPSPNDQLQLVWLLDHFRSHPETSAKLKLRLVSFDLIAQRGESLGKSESHVPTVDVTTEVVETARLAWQAIVQRRRKPASMCLARISAFCRC
jgi:hypothetical protein